ncbi:MAG TPA: TonB-dependent receptor [Candidatus Polarisedimenticolia bacterium]|nr:TonB-dependent receptor [Candidatus Polarisedimenticolia bacterium]
MSRPARGAAAAVWTLLASVGAAAAAEPAPATPAPAETVRVEGRRDERPADRAASCTVILARDFSSRVTTLAELLSETAGLRVASLGGPGSFATVSIRGSTSEQVVVYLDGVPMSAPLGGGVDLSAIPLEQIESIEIYKGSTPIWLDTPGIGGAIAIRTRRPAGLTQAAVSYGSHDTVHAEAASSWAGRPGGWPLESALALGADRSDGDFRFHADNGTEEPGDDGFETRLNNRSWRAGLLGVLEARLPDGGRAELRADLEQRRRGVPGIDDVPSRTARSSSDRAGLRLAVGHDRLLGGPLGLEAGAYATRTAQAYRKRSDGTGPPADASDRIVAAGSSLLLRWRGGQASGLRHQATLHLSGRTETAARIDRTLAARGRGDLIRLSWSAGLEDEIQAAGGRFAFVPSLRWGGWRSRFDAPAGVPEPDGMSGSDGSLAARAGFSWRPAAALAFRANIGRYHRAPSLTELFGDQASIKPSEGLEPERGVNVDAGVSWEPRSKGPFTTLALDAAVYRNQAGELIQLVQTSQSQVVAQNTGRARIAGAELALRLGLPGGLDGGLDYTWQKAEDRTASGSFTRGADLPGRPRHEAAARAGLSGRWGRAGYRFTYVGPYFLDRAAAALAGSGIDRDQIRVPGRLLHDLSYVRPVGSRCELTFELDNAGNVKTVDLARFPLPGRTVQAMLRVRLP